MLTVGLELQYKADWAAGRPTVFHAGELERIGDRCAAETGIGGDALESLPADTVIDLSATLGPPPPGRAEGRGRSVQLAASVLAGERRAARVGESRRFVPCRRRQSRRIYGARRSAGQGPACAAGEEMVRR